MPAEKVPEVPETAELRRVAKVASQVRRSLGLKKDARVDAHFLYRRDGLYYYRVNVRAEETADAEVTVFARTRIVESYHVRCASDGDVWGASPELPGAAC